MKENICYRVKKKLFQRLPIDRTSDQLNRIATTNWDVLVVLDACRLDALRMVADWPVESAVSPGSCTPEWLSAVADHGIFNDVHILAGNPQYGKVKVDFGQESLERCWEDHWDERLQTTLPEPMLETATETAANVSEGVVVHLQPPHWPYVARLGEKWSLAYRNLGPWEKNGEKIISLQVAMQRGLINISKARRAYYASVQSIWEVLRGYLAEWADSGYHVIVTADHGETFGRIREFGFYEHPCGCRISPLVDVPWIEIYPQADQIEKETIKNRLSALGYAE